MSRSARRVGWSGGMVNGQAEWIDADPMRPSPCPVDLTEAAFPSVIPDSPHVVSAARALHEKPGDPVAIATGGPTRPLCVSTNPAARRARFLFATPAQHVVWAHMGNEPYMTMLSTPVRFQRCGSDLEQGTLLDCSGIRIPSESHVTCRLPICLPGPQTWEIRILVESVWRLR